MQLPPLHTVPDPHDIPVAAAVHAVVLTIGWQSSHLFIGSAMPET